MNVYRIPFLRGHRMAVVEVLFGRGLSGWLLVDTGAERTVLSPDLARKLNIDLEDPVSRLSLQGVGGSQPALICRIERMALGAVVLPQREVMVAPLPGFLRADGLLGLDVLRHFRVTFEFDTRVLVLRPLS